MIYTITLNPAIDETIELASFNAGGVSSLLGNRQAIGGKGINVSRALGALGKENEALAVVGENSRAFFEEGARGEGIKLRIFGHEGATRTSSTIVFREECVNTHVRRPQTIGGATAILGEIGEWLRGNLIRGDYVVFAGSLAEGFAADAYATLIAIAQEKGTLAVLDTSGEALEAGIAARPFAMKINIDEFIDMAEQPEEDKADFKSAIAGLHEGGIALVVITMGAGGAVLSDGETFLHARLDLERAENEPVYAVGSGDALLAGFIAGLADEKPLAECLRLGVACGTVSTKNEGAAVFGGGAVEEVLERVALHHE